VSDVKLLLDGLKAEYYSLLILFAENYHTTKIYIYIALRSVIYSPHLKYELKKRMSQLIVFM